MDTSSTLKRACISNVLSKNNATAIISSTPINYSRRISYFLTTFLEIFVDNHKGKNVEYEER